jgi:DNA-binding transcriptional ArsR family regulator
MPPPTVKDLKMPANSVIRQGTVTGTLSLDGDRAGTAAFADKTFQLLYAAAPMAGGDHTDDNELLIALRHPLRRQILRTMAAQNPISPRQISDELRQPLSNVSYHVRVLADCGVVTLVDTAPVRGSMQHFYSTAIEEPWALAVLGLSADEDPAAGGEDEEPAA